MEGQAVDSYLGVQPIMKNEIVQISIPKNNNLKNTKNVRTKRLDELKI